MERVASILGECGGLLPTAGVEARLRSFLAENFILPDRVGTLGGDESFLENGIIDSTGVLEVIFFVEENFDIHVDDHEVVPENFDSLNRLVAYVAGKRAAKPMMAALA
jgi:acyl carrier protein